MSKILLKSRPKNYDPTHLLKRHTSELKKLKKEHFKTDEPEHVQMKALKTKSPMAHTRMQVKMKTINGLKSRLSKAVPKKMNAKIVLQSRSNLIDHQTNLESIVGHSDHKKAIKDHNAGKHDKLSPRMKGAAFHSAMKIHQHYKKHGKDQ